MFLSIRILILVFIWVSFLIFVFKKNNKKQPDENKIRNIKHRKNNNFSNRKEYDDPILQELMIRIKPLTYTKYQGLLSPLNDNLISKIDMKVDKKESFTINKKTIHMCVHDENGRYYHINNLMFVFLHELAHCICDEEGHTEKFGEILEELLRVSSSKGIYDPTIPMTNKYCSYKMDQK